MKKTCHGSCHCGAVRFAAEIDLAAPSLRCNCSYCLKIRCWASQVPPTAFRLPAASAIIFAAISACAHLAAAILRAAGRLSASA